MQSVLCGQLPLAVRQQAVAKRQAGVPSVLGAPRLRCIAARAEKQPQESLTGEWTANWSLASCELLINPPV